MINRARTRLSREMRARDDILLGKHPGIESSSLRLDSTFDRARFIYITQSESKKLLGHLSDHNSSSRLKSD